MKAIPSNYTFNPADKTITLPDYPNLTIEQILLICNVSKNQVLFGGGNGLAAVSTGGIITLVGANTSGMAATDKFQVVLEDRLPQQVTVIGTLNAKGKVTVEPGDSPLGVVLPSDPNKKIGSVNSLNPSDSTAMFSDLTFNSTSWTVPSFYYDFNGYAFVSGVVKITTPSNPSNITMDLSLFWSIDQSASEFQETNSAWNAIPVGVAGNYKTQAVSGLKKKFRYMRPAVKLSALSAANVVLQFQFQGLGQ
jgi:hypothetical protein